MIIGGRAFDFDRYTYVMGILNVTPDSFSDGGRWNTTDKALRTALKMAEEGADIIDVGGESTRPGYTKISDDEEINRVVPVIERIKKETDIPVSIDTYKSGVARAALEAGADLVNDIWGLKYDSYMAKVIAEHKIPCCIMHNRKDTDYTDFLQDVKADLQESLQIAKAMGIADDKIIIDPGIGFAKNYEQNLLMIKNLSILKELGYPILLAASRKSVIGLTLDLPVDERLEGTLAITVYGALNGAGMVRVHDVKENVRALRMLQAIREV
ncbi:MAG: dihydropteroate synthase [Lachnospiraceae bacterium]|nr:dihydropteroate synthase [Lachnospiraceae bacterium]